MMAGRVLCHRNKCVKVLSWGLHSTGMEATVLWFYQCTKQHPSVFMPFNHMGHCGWWYLFWHWLWDQNGNHRKWKCHQDWVSYEFQTMEILVYGNKGGLQPLAVSWQFWPTAQVTWQYQQTSGCWKAGRHLPCAWNLPWNLCTLTYAIAREI